ncbi:MAG TPA: hypothetical protein VEZ14_05710 [Dehalococcoidia bacterium]|nr:hypothetical protein [Dehalococcoidia bacterium]
MGWSPDGRWLTWCDCSSSESGRAPDRIYLARGDGSGAVALPNVPAISGVMWAPDSSRFYVLGIIIGGKPTWGTLYAVDPRSPQSTSAVHLDAAYPAYALSPDGALLAYVNFELQVVVSRLDGAGFTALADSNKKDPPRTLAWSPDGRRLAFLMVDGGVTRLAIARADGSALSYAGEFPSGAVGLAGWSPDGKYVAVSWTEGTPAGGEGRLTAAATDSSRASKTFNTGGWSHAPSRWWPDFRGLYFIGRGDDFRGEVVSNNHLFAVGLDGSDRQVAAEAVSGFVGVVP